MWFVKKKDRPFKGPNETERMLRSPRYKPRMVRDKKKYSRKGRKPSTRQFEGLIQGTISRVLIEGMQ